MDALKSISEPGERLEEIDSLVESLQKEGNFRRNSNRSIRIFLAFIFALFILDFLLGHSRGKSVDVGDFVIYGSLLFGGCAYGLTPGLRKALARAANLSDKRLLGGMIEALNSGEPKMKEILENASAPLLEQVNADDLGLLDDYQMEQLVKAVRLSANPRFCKAAIIALGCIGSTRTLQALEVTYNDPLISPLRRSQLEPHIRAAMGELRIRIAKSSLQSAPSVTRS